MTVYGTVPDDTALGEGMPQAVGYTRATIVHKLFRLPDYTQEFNNSKSLARCFFPKNAGLAVVQVVIFILFALYSRLT